MTDSSLGTWCGMASAVCYTGANIALKRVALPGDADWAMWMSCLKAAPTLLAAMGVIAWRAARGLPALPPRRLVLPLVAVGLVMQFGGNVSFQWALGFGGLGLTVPLSSAVWIGGGAVLGRLLLAEPVSPRSLAAIMALVASIVLLSMGAGQAAQAVMDRPPTFYEAAGAVAASCLAGLSYAFANVMIRRTVTRNVTLSATLLMMSGSGVVGLGLGSLARIGPAGLRDTPESAVVTALVAGVFNAFAFFLLSKSLQLNSMVRANAMGASQIGMSALAGVALFHESLTAWLLAGLVLMGLGLMLTTPAQGSGGPVPDGPA